MTAFYHKNWIRPASRNLRLFSPLEKEESKKAVSETVPFVIYHTPWYSFNTARKRQLAYGIDVSGLETSSLRIYV